MNHRHAAILACLLCPLPVALVAFFWSPETVPASVIPSYLALPAIAHYVRQRRRGATKRRAALVGGCIGGAVFAGLAGWMIWPQCSARDSASWPADEVAGLIAIAMLVAGGGGMVLYECLTRLGDRLSRR